MNARRRKLSAYMDRLENRALMSFGELNTDFGVDGATSVSIGTGAIEAVLDVGGKVLVGGDSGLARFDSAGVIDSTFGTAGKTAISGVNFRDMAVDSTGKIYALTSASSGTFLMRFTAAGKADTAYALNGTARVTSSSAFTGARIAVQSDGKVIVAGTSKTDAGNGAKVRVYRMKTDGTGDSSFGTDGNFEFNFAADSFITPVKRDGVTALSILSNGKIMVGGGGADWSPSSYDPDTGEYIDAAYGNANFAVARLTSGGALDSSFASGGVSRINFADATALQSIGVPAAVPTAGSFAGDGSALIAGSNRQLIAQRFDASGTPTGQTAAGELADLSSASDALLLADGRGVVIGPKTNFNNGENYAMQYVAADGTTGNSVFTEHVGYGYGSPAASIVASSDGDLLVGGGGDGSGFNDLAKFDAGKKTDARPDEFLNARANDIAQDQLGRLHVAYYDAATTTLKYAMRNEFNIWSAAKTVDSNPNAGQYVALDINSKNNPGIAYFDGTNGDLKLALSDGKAWTLRTVESKGSTGLYPTLDFDNTDRPTMTYYKKTTGDLRFARFDPTTVSFSYETVDEAGDVGRSSVLVASPKTSRYSIAYTDTTNNTVKWAGRKKGGVEWSIKTAATTTGGADFLSMSYGYYYEPAISFYDAATADLKLSYFDANQQKFIVKTLATAGAVGLYSQTVFNGYYDPPIVFAYNRSGDRIVRFNNTIGTTVSPTTVAEGAGRYLTTDLSNGRLIGAYFDADTNVLKVRPLSIA